MSTKAAEQSQLRECFFSTNLPDPSLKLTGEPTILQLPLTSRRKDLSKILTSLLNQSREEDPLPQGTSFQFVINSRLLRGTLKEQARKIKHLDCFKTLISIPNNKQKSCILYHCRNHSSKNKSSSMNGSQWSGYSLNVRSEFILETKEREVLVGFFNGQISYLSQKKKATSQIHSKVVTALQSFVAHNKLTIVSSSKDESICVSETSLKDQNLVKHEQVYATEDEVLCLQSNPINPQEFISGSTNGLIQFWSLENKEVKAVGAGDKKKRVESLKPNTLYQLSSSVSSRVLALKWVDLTQVLIGGADHNLRLIDIGGGKQADLKVSVNCNYKTVQALDSRSAQPQLVITGHQDGTLYAWDLRRAEGTPTLTFKETLHKNEEMWISGVRLHPTSNPHFISGHYSGDLKLWDVRKSDTSLYSVKAHQDKLLSFDVDGSEKKVVSGGADGKIVWTNLN